MIDSDGTCNPNWENADFSFYRYEPSVPINAIFIGLFAATTFLHLLQMVKSRTWYLITLVLGGACESVGYLGRLLSALQDPGCWTKDFFVMQTVLILVAPALMAASIYMILGRIILLTDGDHYSLIRRRWLTKIFVVGDVISLLLQAAGGGMLAKGGDAGNTGENMIIAGLFVQLAFFAVFIIIAVIFHRRLSRHPTPQANDPLVRWKWYLRTLYVTGALIWVRSVFRVVEFIEGNSGYLMRHEVYLFVFDGIIMMLVMLWMNWFHPSEVGLLLCGMEPASNGLHLLAHRPSPIKFRLGDGSSLASLNGRPSVGAQDPRNMV